MSYSIDYDFNRAAYLLENFNGLSHDWQIYIQKRIDKPEKRVSGGSKPMTESESASATLQAIESINKKYGPIKNQDSLVERLFERIEPDDS
tara:strand:- start:161 stop:433 length:273 start_codon:yes stop_codon:yes gene_type:complete